MKKPKSTAIAVFLWTQFEVNIIYITFSCYEAMERMITTSEELQMLGVLSELSIKVNLVMNESLKKLQNVIKASEMYFKSKSRKVNGSNMV